MSDATTMDRIAVTASAGQIGVSVQIGDVAYAAELIAADVPTLLVGDYNVVPSDGDIYDTRSYRRNVLLHPELRAAYDRLLRQGWTDALGDLHPGEAVSTFYERDR